MSHSTLTNPSPSLTSPQSDTQFELDLLKEEYFFVQTTIEDYNKQIWGIKALGLTGTGAVIALMIQQQQCIIALIGCAIPILFWILESQWKHFQRGFYPRAYQLELILNDKCDSQGPHIYSQWSKSFKRHNRLTHPNSDYVNYWRDGLLNRSVYVTYVLEIAFLLGLYLFQVVD